MKMITATSTTTLSPVRTFASFGRSQDAQMLDTLVEIHAPDSSIQISHQAESLSSSARQLAQVAESAELNEINLWTPVDCDALFHALIASFSVILVSELGDKTFIITAIMAMKNSRFLVFLASGLALFLMTVLSVGMGVAVTVIPDVYTHYASLVLFLCFGLKMLKEAYDMDGDGEEFDEVERSLDKDEKAATGEKNQGENSPQTEQGNLKQAGPECSSPLDADTNSAKVADPQVSSFVSKIKRTIYVAPIIIKVFTMILVAEWGDRSQISTIILAAREDVVGVFVGSFMGHILCTGLAVTGGRFVANMISVRTMTLIGGIVFLIFAAYEIVSGPEES